MVAWFGSLSMALLLAGPIASLVAGHGDPVEAGLRWDLAAFLVLNGLFSMVAAVGIGRLVFGRRLAVTATDLRLPVVGVLMATAVEIALHEWAEARFGHYDLELVWWTAGLGAMLVVTAVATFGVLIAPTGAAVAPRIAQTVGAVLVCLIVLSNASGLLDGIEPASWPLAILVGLSGLYVLLAVVVTWRRAAR